MADEVWAIVITYQTLRSSAATIMILRFQVNLSQPTARCLGFILIIDEKNHLLGCLDRIAQLNQ